MGHPDEEPAGNGGVDDAGRPPRLAGRDRVSGDAVDVVARLKEESEVPLRSHGSLSLNRALMAAGLVDRLQVTLFPVVTGQTGLDPIFQGAADFDLELVENRTLDGHIQELTYRPTLH
jgi:dihydrofolate reductase